jgi:hypothetical protein
VGPLAAEPKGGILPKKKYNSTVNINLYFPTNKKE